MIVFISDLHLTDGTSGQTIDAGAFKLFRDRLGDLAYDASWHTREPGVPIYEPLEGFDIILLGDILDIIRSNKWLSGKTRPWDNWTSPVFIKKIADITDAILAQNKDSLDIFKSMQNPDVLTIPDATKAGRPKKVGRDPDDKGRVPVRARVHYMVGNHDWFFHLPGTTYDNIRKKIVPAMGLTNMATVPFPHDPAESSALTHLLYDHQVFARHGDIYDPWNHEQDRNASSLGDAIVVELLNRFPDEVAKQLGAQLNTKCLNGLKEIDNVRPLWVVPGWIAGVLRRACPDPRQATQIKDIWNGLADDFLKLPFVRERDKWFPFDMVDKLEAGLKLSRDMSLSALDRMIDWWGDLLKIKPNYDHALSEREFKNRNARHIVYGHTHQHAIIPLDACVLNDQPFNQTYVNTGTWRRVHERAVWRPQEQEFMSQYVMTYAAFFKDGERNGRSFDIWSGALG